MTQPAKGRVLDARVYRKDSSICPEVSRGRSPIALKEFPHSTSSLRTRIPVREEKAWGGSRSALRGRLEKKRRAERLAAEEGQLRWR